MGFDIKAGANRTFRWDKVAKFLPLSPEDEAAPSGAIRARKGAIKRGAMFRRLGSRKFLKTGVDGNEVWVGFDGPPSRIASIHQDGLVDRPGPKGKSILYPRRPLLGLAAVDREEVLNMLLEHVSPD